MDTNAVDYIMNERTLQVYSGRNRCSADRESKIGKQMLKDLDMPYPFILPAMSRQRTVHGYVL